VSHRDHASVSAITEFIPSYAGYQFEEEIKHLSTAFNPEHPFLFILGGAKFETKLPLLEKFINSADKIFVGGALANNFFKEMGQDIGDSLVSPENYDLQRFLNTKKIILPIDSLIKDKKIMDASTKTVELLRQEIDKAKYILWNGPLGAYESGYRASTLQLAEILADATSKGVKTIVGGGDTLATIAELKLENGFTFVSTGGGAMLDYLAKGTLPGIEALERGL
jgi:3-phosphoglycerate kinase